MKSESVLDQNHSDDIGRNAYLLVLKAQFLLYVYAQHVNLKI